MSRSAKILALGVATLIPIMMLNLSVGSVPVPISDLLIILSGQESPNQSWETIIWDFRFPKIITAILAGAGLAISGLLMQTLFRNPLAGPFVLGISSGASLGVAILIMVVQWLGWVSIIDLWGAWATVMASVWGAALVLLLIMVASFYIADSMTLLIIGLMLGSLSGALVSIFQYFSQAESVHSYLIWTFGSLSGVHGVKLLVMAAAVSLGLLAAVFMVKPLNSLLLGESYAQTMGVRVKPLRLMIIMITALLAGGITAFCGPLAFLGIAIPHLARVILRTSNHALLIPACILFGAIALVSCDIIAQLPGMSQTLPINAVTSLLGAPAVIAILIRNRQLGNTFAK